MIVSKHYCAKEWPRLELRQLLQKGKTILPILHGISNENVRELCPEMADLVSLYTSEGLEDVAAHIVETVEGSSSGFKPTQRPARTLWNLPSPTSLFVGRQALLEDITRAFSAGKRIVVLKGIDGVGKTEVASKFARANASYYELVWWLHAQEEQDMGSQMDCLAKELGLLEAAGKDQTITTEAVQRWLKKNGRWLLVFDGMLRRLKLFHTFFDEEAHPTGRILVTSPGGDWRSIGAEPLKVSLFGEEEAIAFFQKRIARERLRGDRELVSALGGLPLALEQAGAYIEESEVSCRVYLSEFLKHQGEMLGKFRGHARTVSTTLGLSLKRIKHSSSEALMNSCAFLSSDRIPRSLFSKDLVLFDESREPLPAHSAFVEDVNVAIAELKSIFTG